MSVRKQTGGEMPRGQPAGSRRCFAELGGCQNPEVLSLRRQGHEHN